LTLTTPLLEVSALRLERGGRQLMDNFSLSVATGELVFIEGANGSGKTSLLRVLAGLSRYGHEGDIRCEVPLLYLGHRLAIKQFLTPRENLDWYCRSKDLVGAAIDEALDAVGLYGYEDVQCRNLSAGQQRRVNLARLQLSRDQLWLLDEPFTSIDRAGVTALGETLTAQLARGGGIVMTSHQDLALQHPIRRISLDSK
jgi:heme exporter protein A